MVQHNNNNNKLFYVLLAGRHSHIREKVSHTKKKHHII